MTKVCNYTGNEPSPKGLGYCARHESLGTKMKGKDGNMWIVQERANGSRAWIKFIENKSNKDKFIENKSNKDKFIENKSNNKKSKNQKLNAGKNEKSNNNKSNKGKTIKGFTMKKWNNLIVNGKVNNQITKNQITKEQMEIYETLMKMGPVFNDHGINVFYCLWHQHTNEGGHFYIQDDPWNMLAEKDRDYLKKPYIIIAFKLYYDSLEKRKHFAKLEDVCLQHTLTKKYKPIVDSIMFKEFKHLYSWNGTPQKAICVRV